VITGQVEFWLGEERIILGPGDTLLVPSNASHGARVVGDAVVESINVMTPIRRVDLTFPST
jgi:quercetin dioxygenase-like cupin family protein